MKLPRPHTLREIAAIINCSFNGDPEFVITGINEIHQVENGDIVFVDHPKYYDKALQSAASVVIINKEVPCPEGKCLLFSDDPFSAYNYLTRHFSPWAMPMEGRGSNVSIGQNCFIHPSVIMGNNVTVGNNCIVHPGVVLYNDIVIGDNVIIHANTVIGSDAFYYKNRPEGREKMHSVGSVVIEEHVEIGAACTIDRGVSGPTRIGARTKIDNQVHIGHDTLIGKKCLFAAQVGIAGCVKLDDEVTLWGQVGVTSDVHIGKGAVVLGQCGVTKDLVGGKTYFGTPAEDARNKYRELALIRKLPKAMEQLGL
ncbi:MAG: UDP-3-O-(3-hydroxymyristoyl)glucosamine N-acyltransferase [Flavobacteriales bacterium]|jgi:UDP-3-O-[3-hydroxymyristoyl] glucosamine N-acyltransferase